MTLKAWAFGLGVSVGVVGMALTLRWLVWVAVVLLGVAFLLRFLSKTGADAR
ncbi:MAG TPA: hypothetical protein VL563_17220 [Gemmatimonadales bacterium]|jgi:hypothetical protein|nr:hypothetical protein [Gemmatimonadales bacterium]